MTSFLLDSMATGVILEILNSLVIIFLATEIHRIWNSPSTSSPSISQMTSFPPSSSTLSSLLSSYSSILLTLLLWSLLIFLYYHHLPIQSLLLSLSPSSPLSIILLILLILLFGIFLFITFQFPNKSSRLLLSSLSSFSQQRFVLPLLSLLSLLFFSGFFFLHSGNNIYVQWLSQFSLIVLSFIAVLYLDIHRFRDDISIRKFFLGLFQAVLYSLGAIPILMILISFFFLILSSLLEALGAHPENSAIFNQLIYYGTLYGPFYVIYWNAKHRLLRSPYLP